MNSAPHHFDLLNSPLAGKNLLEASAGTGKTYTIAGLFLRLLLEANIPVERILVVTFTEAATNELEDRIRTTLHKAREGFTNKSSDDPFLDAYIKKHKKHECAIDQLHLALQNFDEAAILTIHTFCNRVLQENAFESGGLFEAELITEQTELLRQIVQDFWRRNFYSASGLFVRYALNDLDPDALFRLVQGKVGLPDFKIIPPVAAPDCSSLEARFESSFQTARALWLHTRDEVASLLLQANGLNKRSYNKEKIPAWMNAMDACLGPEQPTPVLFKDFGKFTSGTIARSMNKGHTPLKHRFFDACEQLLNDSVALANGFEQRLIALKTEVFDYVRQELQKRKQERNILYFDDLLLNLHAALHERGDTLTRAVSEEYRAALIDEFQDTDPVQYEIFRRIFEREERPFFLIGDPKQAIYGFRGADIFAYMRARAETRAENRATLSTNYRSAPALITATNAIFSRAPAPFVYPEIPFQSASPAPDQSQREELIINGEQECPLRVWYVDASVHHKKDRALSRHDACALITRAVVAEIVRLLALGREGRAVLGDRALAERDIAVLVRFNRQASDLQAALSAANVHSVLYSTANLFDARETVELATILAAVAEPRRQSLLKSALATEAIGVSGEALFNFTHEDDGFEVWFDKFMRYHEIWQQHGFMRMFRDLMRQEQIPARLMRYADGERRMTNLLHLAETLNQTETTRKLGMAGLLKWLAEHQASAAAPSDEHQLRLESDENAVKLVTMHKCKGLEYPVVFCPFTWHGSWVRRQEPIKFHDETQERTFTLDLGSEARDHNKTRAEKETLAENLRLLYVALTRAKHRCTLVWGRFGEGSTSAPAYLLHQPEKLDPGNLVECLKNHLKELNDPDLRADLQKLMASSSGAIQVEDLPRQEAPRLPRQVLPEQSLSARRFTARVDSGDRLASYSWLISGHPYSAELADYDLVGVQGETEETPGLATEEQTHAHFLRFPRGAKTGTFVHDILQNLDFAESSQEWVERLVGAKLNAYGFDEKWLGAVCDMIERVRAVPLRGPGGAFTLSHITRQARLSELEFYFPLRQFSPRALAEVFSGNAGGVPPGFAERLATLSFVPFKGLMKGFIDMVFEHAGRFYIIDWKSNYLGSEVVRYNQTTLTQAMVDNLYILQAHIYAVALEQYLRVRLPDYTFQSHFGGIFYIFLRGLDVQAGPELGVYQAGPDERLLSELSARLVQENS
ncbi:MAG: exodeoxyribonuclease V subunit beta [bacterium]